MSEWKKVKIGDICKIVKGTTGIASAEPGQYPLVVTAEERKTCSTYQFDCEAVCIPLVSSSGCSLSKRKVCARNNSVRRNSKQSAGT